MSRCCCDCFDSSPARLNDIPLISKLLVRDMGPASLPRSKAEETYKIGGCYCLVDSAERLIWLHWSPADPMCLKEAPTSSLWSCVLKEVQESACPLSKQRSNPLLFYRSCHCYKDGVCFLNACLLLACKVAWDDCNFCTSYAFKYFPITTLKLSFWRIFFTFLLLACHKWS